MGNPEDIVPTVRNKPPGLIVGGRPFGIDQQNPRDIQGEGGFPAPWFAVNPEDDTVGGILPGGDL
jgi:hypothetical protein